MAHSNNNSSKRQMRPGQAMRRLSDGGVANAVFLADDHQLDAFGKLRVTQPFGLYESKHIYNVDDRRTWASDVTGDDASITLNSNESTVEIKVGTADAEVSIFQNDQYWIYVPGRSHHIVFTTVFGEGKENCVQRIGYFDDNDGLFFELDGTDLYVVRRSSISGSAVDDRIHQNDPTKSTDGVSFWNFDTLDGNKDPTNPSEALLDIAKAQIFVIDFQWLGVGRVRFGASIEGRLTYFHSIQFANSGTGVYMSTPNLPMRAEVRNTGVTTGNTILKQICASVQTEGGTRIPGFEFSTSNGIVTRNISVRTPILAVRMLQTFGGKANRVIMELLSASIYSNADAYYEILHLHNPTIDTGAWNPIFTDDSAVEVNKTLTTFSASAEHLVTADFVTAATGASKSGIATKDFEDFISRHRFIYQNKDNSNSNAFVIAMTPFSGAADVSGSFGWVELY